MTTRSRVLGLALVPRFLRPVLPAGFRRGEGARPHADDATLGRWLSSVRPWQGAVPASLAELPATSLVRERRQEFANDSELDHRLRLLAAIDRCVRGAGVSPGAAVVTFWFDVQADGDRGRMVGKRVSVEATTLASKDDDAFQGCLSTAHVGTGFVREGPPEPSEHVWPTTLPVPVKNHELFRWLMSKDDG